MAAKSICSLKRYLDELRLTCWLFRTAIGHNGKNDCFVLPTRSYRLLYNLLLKQLEEKQQEDMLSVLRLRFIPVSVIIMLCSSGFL